MQFSDLKQIKYVATQPLVGGLDEVQQLFLSWATGSHVALSGPPGVGKTTIVEEFASVVGQPLVSRVMGPRVNESMLISYPDLVSDNGSTATVTRHGLLANALSRNAIYFADEIDRLTEDNQKLHNSAFDNRRSVTLRDGTLVQGGDDFFGIIAYNPTQGLKNDLENALADRFVHINFDYYPPEVEAAIAMRGAGLKSNGAARGKLVHKAVYFQNKKGRRQVRFFKVLPKKTSVYLEPIGGGKKFQVNLETSQKLCVYASCDRPAEDLKAFVMPDACSVEEMSLKLAEFCRDLRSLALKGTHGFDRTLLAKFSSAGEEVEFNNIRLHLPSARIIQAALKQMECLLQMGHPPVLAQTFAVTMVVQQAGYGKFGSLKIGKSTNRELLMTLAGAKGLLPLRKQRAV